MAHSGGTHEDESQAHRTADLAVSTVSTATVLRTWAALDPVHARRIPEILQRITTLARFRPRQDDPGLEWWESVSHS